VIGVTAHQPLRELRLACLALDGFRQREQDCQLLGGIELQGAGEVALGAREAVWLELPLDVGHDGGTPPQGFAVSLANDARGTVSPTG